MKQINLTEIDKINLINQHISLESLYKQFDFIVNNHHFTEVQSPCLLDNGVIQINDEDEINENELNNAFKNVLLNNELIKFVPASGASSRMFAFLIKYFHYLVDEKISITEKENLEVDYFFDNLHKFSFFDLLPIELIQKYNLEYLNSNNLKNLNIDLKFRYEVLNNLLYTTQDNNEIFGLNYANEAKGNIKFHKILINNVEFTLNAFESHIWENLELILKEFYSNKDTQNIESQNIEINDILNQLIPIEFSVNEKLYYHYNEIENSEINYEIYDNLIKILLFKFPNNQLKIENIFKLLNQKITYSKQDKSTNSLAFDKDLNIIRHSNGEFVTRAGGHGALIYNIQEINQDYIFIKNIDNTTKLELKNEINKYTKEIIGFTKIIKDKIDYYLNDFKENENDKEIIDEASNFIKKYLIEDFDISKYEVHSNSNQDLNKVLINDIKNILDRPLRVVGVVKNTGEPGGGPFYINLNDKKNDILSKFKSKQIIELSQIEMSKESQKNIVENSLYFNPVFMVLNTKNNDGEKYNLLDYMSENMAMLVEKTHGTDIITSYEFPGLWNGAMAYWNTIFVELPNIIFHPVKTVNDLLKPGHL